MTILKSNIYIILVFCVRYRQSNGMPCNLFVTIAADFKLDHFAVLFSKSGEKLIKKIA